MRQHKCSPYTEIRCSIRWITAQCRLLCYHHIKQVKQNVCVYFNSKILCKSPKTVRNLMSEENKHNWVHNWEWLLSLGKVACAFLPRTREADEGGSLWALGHPGLLREFQTNQDDTVRYYLKKLSFIYTKTKMFLNRSLSLIKSNQLIKATSHTFIWGHELEKFNILIYIFLELFAKHNTTQQKC